MRRGPQCPDRWCGGNGQRSSCGLVKNVSAGPAAGLPQLMTVISSYIVNFVLMGFDIVNLPLINKQATYLRKLRNSVFPPDRLLSLAFHGSELYVVSV